MDRPGYEYAAGVIARKPTDASQAVSYESQAEAEAACDSEAVGTTAGGEVRAAVASKARLGLRSR